MTDSQDSQPTEALTRRSRRDPGAGGGSSRAVVRTQTGDSAPPRAGGIAALVRKHPRAWLIGAGAVAFLILGTSAVFVGASVGASNVQAAPVPTETLDPRPQPAAIPESSRVRTCSVASILADPRLNVFSGHVINANTGEVLLDRNGALGQRTGSVLKVITAAAALKILGASAQLTTQVIDGSQPGSIVLKGGGDPTLASGNSNVYDGAARIGDLANAAMASYEQRHPGVPITEIVLDSTMWNPADRWDSTWLRKEQSDGYQAEVTALMVDGGRSDPSSEVSWRTSDGIGDAGRAFANAAGLTGVTFTSGAAVGSTVLAEVKSQPLSVLINQMLLASDNVLAENLARVTSKAMGFDGSSTSLAQAIPGALVEYGLPTTTIVIRDGSGLSNENAVPPEFLTALMVKLRANEQNLGVVYSSLPVAGQTGTLAGRFDGPNEIARGAVIAKTGWLDAEYSLAGIVNAADGTPLAFAFYSIAEGIAPDTKDAQDTLATALFTCGDNLSNN